MGTNYLAPTWRQPENTNKDKLSNYSLYFDGSGHEINCGTGDDVNITGPISISVWFNADSVDNARGIVCKNDAAAQQTFAQYFLDLLSNEIRWRAGRSTVTYGINAGQWYHAVGTFDGNDIKLYIDGTEVATSVAAADSYASAQPMYIGRRLNQSYFSGEISQVCIFDYSLNQDQINYLYSLNNPMAISGAEPVAYWPLGDNSNPTAVAGYPNISVGADSVFDFDRSSVEAITAFDVPVTTFTEASFSVWVNFDTITGTYQYVMGMGSGPGSFMSISKNQNSGTWYTYDGSGSKTMSTSPVANRWYHVVVTQAGTERRFYVDGVEDANSPFTCPALAIPYNNLTLGVYNNQSTLPATPLYRLDGQLCNVQVWDKKIEQSDVTTIYNNGQPLMTGAQPQAANLRAWYKLNESANWEADSALNWQIPDNRSAYPQSFEFKSPVIEQIDLGTELNFTSAMTFTAWVKVDTTHHINDSLTFVSNVNGTPDIKYVFRYYQASGAGKFFRLQLWANNGVVKNYNTYANNNGAPNYPDISDNKWHLVGFSCDGTTDADGIRMYVDEQAWYFTADNPGIQSSTLDKSAFTNKHLEPKSSISFFISAPLFSCLPQIVIAFAPLAAKSFAVSAPLP